MEIISSFKKQKVLHITTVTDSELLGVGGVSARPIPHHIVPFRQDQEQGACIMQLDLMKAAHKAPTEAETELQANIMNTCGDGQSNSRLLEDTESENLSNIKHKEEQQSQQKKRVFELMQKSYTELSQLLTLAQSLHSEKYMTLLTCTRPGGLQPVGTSLPAMQRVAILKNNLQSLVKPLQDSAAKILQISKQRQVFTKHLLQLKRKWKLSTNGAGGLGSRGRRALTGRDVLAIDCGLGIGDTAVLPMLGSCIVPLLMDVNGRVKLPVLEKTRTFQTLSIDLCSPQGLKIVSCNSWDICKQNLLPLGALELEEVHRHCQQRQQEMLDSALMACIRSDASTRSDRWILAPPISIRAIEPFGTANSNTSSNQAQKQKQKQAQMQIGSKHIEDALSEFVLLDVPVSDKTEFDVQDVHRAEVVVRLTDSLLLRFQLKSVESSQEQQTQDEKQTNIQDKALHILSNSLLNMHVSMLRNMAKTDEVPASAITTAAGGGGDGDVVAGTESPTPTVLPACVREICSALRALL